MLWRTIETFIFAGIVTALSSWIFSIRAIDLVALALVIAPMAVLQMHFNSLRNDFIYSGSIVFHKYNWLFRLVQLFIILTLGFGLYRYGSDNGIGTTIAYFISASVVQAPYYAILRRKVSTEISLALLTLAGVCLFIYFTIL